MTNYKDIYIMHTALMGGYLFQHRFLKNYLSIRLHVLILNYLEHGCNNKKTKAIMPIGIYFLVSAIC